MRILAVSMGCILQNTAAFGRDVYEGLVYDMGFWRLVGSV